jgi:hypothetical protein
MTFRFTEQHREEYLTDGLTILHGLIPATLLAELRREADKGRELARAQHGPQVQRIQPVYAYAELDHRPFREFLALPELRACVEATLGGDHGPSEIMGILLEPRDVAWCTNWHRDWLNVPGMDMAAFNQVRDNLQMFNQLNGALYDDHSLWVVRGSHNRPDSAAERNAFPTIPPAPPELPAHLSAVERELTCTEYVRSMPGAVQVVLSAGDIAFYRSTAWHIGTYVPYVKRATLHDGFYGPEDHAWRERMKPLLDQAGRMARARQSA